MKKKNAVSIIIPTWNEEENIESLVKRIHHALTKAKLHFEIIFIDDHSTDKTQVIIRKLTRKFPVTLFTKRGVRGKAQSLIEGFSRAKHEIVCMIDADLQYPPEAIPEMLRELQKNVDIVVANRKITKVPFIRKFLSRGYMYFFGKLLHNLDVDVQSGLKLFRKRILSELVLTPSPWSFDTEFLIKARRAGFGITSVPITFSPRHSGRAKINLLQASWEIGKSSLLLRFFSLRLTSPQAMPGVITYKGKEFRHYSKLAYHETALITVTPFQKKILALILLALGLGILIHWHITLMILITVLTAVYFADLLFNFFLIYRSFTKNPEIKVLKKELAAVAATKWPKYTVFCPLYQEWNVLPQFITAMSNLDYPKNKLQVMLLLEEDDAETVKQVSQMALPSYFQTVIVPHSLPKTKPKALNYGLMKATGEYVVVYDAEDIPDPQQLKKAVLAFQKTGRKTICMQAKLNFYNPQQNLITRLFTAEYSLWFDLILTGLQSIKAPIPLGGTSNHFKLKDIHALGGWDAFNVTEDCDLGTRLIKKGYYTAIFDSETLEEANSNLKNWYAQRSRWIKGYIQTYLVHMRYPRSFFTETKEPHFFTFQFIVGGKILALFINPLMWATTASYFLFRPIIGETIESLYLTPIFYMGVFSIIIGNFLYLYYYMVGCAKRGQEELIPFVFLVPFYWLGMSVASWKALFETVRKPHYWSKTHHGLHLTEIKSGKFILARWLRPLPISPTFIRNLGTALFFFK